MDWAAVRRDGHTVFTKLIRTKDPREPEGNQEVAIPAGRQRLSVSTEIVICWLILAEFINLNGYSYEEMVRSHGHDFDKNKNI